MERSKDTSRPRPLARAIGAKSDINDKRPANAEAVPQELIEKHGSSITSVWWHAKGRDQDPTIGVEIKGIRKTFGGYTWKDWWYFMKVVHPAKSEDEMPQCYWYRKRKLPDPSEPQTYEIAEEYIGERLHDPDTGYDLEIVPEIKHHPEELCQ